LRSGIVVFQAHIRGYLARRRFREAKQAREEEVRRFSIRHWNKGSVFWDIMPYSLVEVS
jgi:kynureninase